MSLGSYPTTNRTIQHRYEYRVTRTERGTGHALLRECWKYGMVQRYRRGLWVVTASPKN